MNKNIKEIAESKPACAYSIFCGIIKTKSERRDEMLRINHFQEWQTHVFQDNQENASYDAESLKASKTLINDLENIYYSSFINCLFPDDTRVNQFSSDVKSYTKPLRINFGVDGANVFVKYLDLFFFPENLLIYCFKCEFSNHSLNEIIKLNNSIRDMDCEKIEFLCPVLKNFTVDTSLRHGNKLKLFTVIQDTFALDVDYSSDNLLYDLGTCSPIGTSIGEGTNPSIKPSNDYFRFLIDKYKVSVFENWTALCLFDSFTLIHKGSIYNYNWEFRYFRLLYVHSLFIKNYLVVINKDFFLELNNMALENNFHEFNKYFNLKQISYNFLPQIIYERIRSGFNIESELAEIRQSIERDHKQRQEKRQLEESISEKRINRALFIVAILAVFTAVWDGSEWIFTLVKGEHGVIFNVVSVTCIVLIYSSIIYFLRKRKIR